MWDWKVIGVVRYERESITINDVAKEADVSITTVSRVFNNNYPVKKETKERVEKAIQKLNYKPNTMARGLIMKRTSVIGVIVPGLTNLFFPTIVEAIENVTKNKGYTISLSNTSGNAEVERSLVNKMVSMQVDGIIAIDPAVENIDNGFYREVSRKLPVIIVNANSSKTKLNHVSYNEEIGTREAFEYLKSLGHSKIAFLRGEKSFSYDLKEKIYNEMIGRDDYKMIIRVRSGNTIDGIAEVETRIQELFKFHERPTAVFACNDLMAVGVLGACNNLGLNVPQDISIIGFDNTLISRISFPKITTVDLRMDEVGKRAAEELLNIIGGNSNKKIKVVLNTALVIRESCSKIKA
jgi:LacI family transcriptional regulator